MLIGVSPIISPELLRMLCEMGHGDELVLADSNFPGVSMARRLVRADGLSIADLLAGIAPLFPFDKYDQPLFMMQVVTGDTLDSAVEADYMNVIRKYHPQIVAPQRIERHAFYERARSAYAVLMSGETRIYGNLIIKKGVVV
ncbi:MAG: L-fucose mutarotase [Terracidiphilus sp.]|jgi:L-fucose mutarotase